MQHRVGRGQPAGEGERVLATLQRREAALQRVAGRIAGARILEPLVLARPRLRVGGGEVDRRHHRAGSGIGLLACVDGQRFETIAVAGAHGGAA